MLTSPSHSGCLPRGQVGDEHLPSLKVTCKRVWKGKRASEQDDAAAGGGELSSSVTYSAALALTHEGSNPTSALVAVGPWPSLLGLSYRAPGSKGAVQYVSPLSFGLLGGAAWPEHFELEGQLQVSGSYPGAAPPIPLHTRHPPPAVHSPAEVGF